MCGENSVTHWLEELQDGQPSDAQLQLWNRYFDRLTAMARLKLNGAPQRAADEEDVALSALNSFFQAARDGRYADLTDRTKLWHLLVRITVSKSLNQIRRQKAKKRGAGKVMGESGLGVDDEARARAIDQVIGAEPTPQFAAEISEQCERLMAMLDNDELRTVARLRLEGNSNAQIAAELDVVERTVERKLNLIRKCWSRELGEPFLS